MTSTAIKPFVLLHLSDYINYCKNRKFRGGFNFVYFVDKKIPRN